MPTPTPKKGFATSEFWLSLIAVILPVIATQLDEASQASQVIGLIISGLAALGYTAARTSVKNNSNM